MKLVQEYFFGSLIRFGTPKLAILLVVLCYVFPFQGARGIYESTEGRYSDVAYTMLASGDWVHPKLHSEQPHWTKPPLYYWATAASLKLFGKNAFAMRFPNALAYLLTLVLVGFMGRIFTPKHPWLSALIFGTCLFPIAASNAISTDGMLTLFETAAMACFAMLCLGKMDKANRLLWSMAGSVLLGLAFLTKGPPALLPLLGILIFLIIDKDLRTNFHWQSFVIGLILFVMVGGSWFFYVINENPDLLNYFLKHEVVNRVATAEHKRNAGPFGGFIVYLPTLIIGTLPWSKAVFSGIYKNAKQAILFARKKGSLPEKEDLFLLCWILIPLMVFFLAKSRLPLYILPLFIPLALIAARNISVEIFHRTKVLILLFLLIAAMILLRATIGFVQLNQDSRVLADQLDNITQRDYTEVVFVDTRPHYGLSIYLDVPIEQIDFRDHYDGFVPLETLEAELRVNGQNRIWMVAENDSEGFVSYLKEKGINVKLLGWVKGMKKFGVYRFD
ncbi:MAG: glycosyltransferase family 39 protein [Gammaproteobacteria bacterium]|nr:glycosyltransferase family 39 protein [Gammaproteobacteria bacterium]